MSTQSGNGFWLRKIAAAAGALALGVAGLAGLSQTAQADDSTPVTGVGNINPDTSTSLTIHKYDGAQGAVGDGTVQDTSKMGNPLKGVEFTVTPVTYKGDTKIDLDTEAGWDAIDGITANDVTESGSAYTKDTANATKITTDASGTATKSLPHGLYLVEETGSGDNNIVSSVAPFLVTLPLPQTKGNWLYDVNVYPKNQVLSAPVKTINKTEDQTGVKVGDTVEYKIKQTVPRLNEGETYKQAVIYDILKAEELAYNDTTSVSLNGTPLVKDKDYTVAADGSSWTLTSARLATLKADDVITVVFTAKVLKVTESGAIENGPGSGKPGEPGYGSTFNGTTTPGTTTPYTYWGQLQVIKQDESKNPLKDAQFAVTATAADGSCPADIAGTHIADGTSDATGTVQWNANPTSPLGLFVANSSDGPLQNPSKDYCLYETKAPAGFIVGTFDHKVTIKPVTTTGVNTVTVTVTNVQQNHPKLPLTGAQGIVLMSVLGIVLIAAGGTIYMVSRRRANQR
jgi:fimbrial isopeptide formation D2 family protein/LPXTG-motif cell wall-anchored protein